MQAHGGGVILVDGLYYQIGENKLDGSAFQSINCYSSPDLVNWKFVNKLLTVGQGAADLAAGRVVERPHVIYNDATKKYVMVCMERKKFAIRGTVLTCGTIVVAY